MKITLRNSNSVPPKSHSHSLSKWNSNLSAYKLAHKCLRIHPTYHYYHHIISTLSLLHWNVSSMAAEALFCLTFCPMCLENSTWAVYLALMNIEKQIVTLQMGDRNLLLFWSKRDYVVMEMTITKLAIFCESLQDGRRCADSFKV